MFPDAGELDRMATYVYLTPSWTKPFGRRRLAVGEGPWQSLRSEAHRQIGDASDLTDRKSPGHPSMSCCSREPLRVMGEVTEWPLYHGTRADLKQGI